MAFDTVRQSKAKSFTLRLGLIEKLSKRERQQQIGDILLPLAEERLVVPRVVHFMRALISTQG